MSKCRNMLFPFAWPKWSLYRLWDLRGCTQVKCLETMLSMEIKKLPLASRNPHCIFHDPLSHVFMVSTACPILYQVLILTRFLNVCLCAGTPLCCFCPGCWECSVAPVALSQDAMNALWSASFSTDLVSKYLYQNDLSFIDTVQSFPFL